MLLGITGHDQQLIAMDIDEGGITALDEGEIIMEIAFSPAADQIIYLIKNNWSEVRVADVFGGLPQILYRFADEDVFLSYHTPLLLWIP
jgi:hypothetical protein